jgi:hypothetical protein
MKVPALLKVGKAAIMVEEEEDKSPIENEPMTKLTSLIKNGKPAPHQYKLLRAMARKLKEQAPL